MELLQPLPVCRQRSCGMSAASAWKQHALVPWALVNTKIGTSRPKTYGYLLCSDSRLRAALEAVVHLTTFDTASPRKTVSPPTTIIWLYSPVKPRNEDRSMENAGSLHMRAFNCGARPSVYNDSTRQIAAGTDLPTFKNQSTWNIPITKEAM